MSGFLQGRNVRFLWFDLASTARRLGCVRHGRGSTEDLASGRRGVPARSSRAARRLVNGVPTSTGAFVYWNGADDNWAIDEYAVHRRQT